MLRRWRRWLLWLMLFGGIKRVGWTCGLCLCIWWFFNSIMGRFNSIGPSVSRLVYKKGDDHGVDRCIIYIRGMEKKGQKIEESTTPVVVG